MKKLIATICVALSLTGCYIDANGMLVNANANLNANLNADVNATVPDASSSVGITPTTNPATTPATESTSPSGSNPRIATTTFRMTPSLDSRNHRSWIDSGISLEAGQTIRFVVTGSVGYSQSSHDYIYFGPEGLDGHKWGRLEADINSLAPVARLHTVDEAVPVTNGFYTAPAAGRLFLNINTWRTPVGAEWDTFAGSYLITITNP